MLGESIGAAPIMLLVTYRPGYQHRWSEKSYYSQMALHPLSAAESGTLVASVLGWPRSPRSRGAHQPERPRGIPFIWKRSPRSFLERGIIQRDGDGISVGVR